MDRVSLTPDLELSRIVYGMWRIGDDADTSPAHVQAKIEACLGQGITTMDQADIYGGYTAEAILGAAFKASPSLRHKVELVTKCDIVAPAGRYQSARVKHYNTSRTHIQASVEHSLQDMATDRIDLLLIHRPDPFMDHHETGKALDELVASGKVRAVGVSNFKRNDWTLLQSAMSTKLCTNQVELSVLNHAPFIEGEVQWMQELGIHPMAWSPLGGGGLFGAEGEAVRHVLQRMASAQNVDVAAIAIAWLLAHPARILPVMGTNKIDRIQAFNQAVGVKIDRQDWFEILTAAQGHEVP
ncbi:MAG: aldo/keto reductase family oxidoreductase [Hyphomicrobiales bacterium]